MNHVVLRHCGLRGASPLYGSLGQVNRAGGAIVVNLAIRKLSPTALPGGIWWWWGVTDDRVRTINHSYNKRH
jgi:hypothetical protein